MVYGCRIQQKIRNRRKGKKSQKIEDTLNEKICIPLILNRIILYSFYENIM